jgi:hypothetical protein
LSLQQTHARSGHDLCGTQLVNLFDEPEDNPQYLLGMLSEDWARSAPVADHLEI